MTNNAQLSHELYKWLSGIEVLPGNQRYKPNGNFGLDSRVEEELLSGYLIGKLLLTLAENKKISLNTPLIMSIKNSNTPAARIYNWNILSDGFNKLAINLPKETQKQITSGNFDALVQFLIDVQKRAAPKVQRSPINPQNLQKSFDVKNVPSFEEIKTSQTLLEFIVVGIASYLNLSPKQAVSTLSESSKFLAHMIVKGIKGSYDQIIQLLQFYQLQIPHMVFLAEKDPSRNYQLLLQIFKPTLISRQPDVSKEGALALEMFIEETLKYNGKNIVYQILCKEAQPFDFIYMGLKRHPYLNFQIWQFLHPLISQGLMDFFQIQFKRTINNEQQYLRAFLILLQPMLQHQQTKQKFTQTNYIHKWNQKFDTALNARHKNKEQAAISEQSKLLYVQIIITMWKQLYEDLSEEQAEEILLKIIEEYKKNTRLEIFTIIIPSLYRLFDLLEFLAKKKNKLAAIIYKKVIFLFVENHQSAQIREIILENFILLLKQFPTIPLEFLLDPLLKQLTTKQGQTYILNIFDFQFMIEVCKHPKMEEYFAVQFLQFFSKLYPKTIIYSPLILRIIQIICGRFCQSESIRESIIKSCQSNLNLYGMLVFGKKNAKINYSNYDKNKKKQESIINNQKKSLIIELIKYFIELQHSELSNIIKKRVAGVYVFWYEEKNVQDKGLASILQLFGDVQEVCLQFKVQKMDEVEQHSSLSNRQKVEELKINQKDADYDKSLQFMENYGIGYKKKKHKTTINKKSLKPDPRVLEDLEKIKQKWKMENSRARLKNQQMDNSKEIQKSIGYNKLPNISGNKILHEFDTVKVKNLKVGQDFIDLDEEEDRENQSIENIVNRYSKYMKILFRKYAYASNLNSKSGIIGQNVAANEEMILSFTEIMRMLKDKGLSNKIPKIAVNQILTTINSKKRKQKNVIGGIVQRDFPMFLVYFTDLALRSQKFEHKDQPFGMKVQQLMLRLLEDEKVARQLFDPKVIKLKETIQEDQQAQIPQGYKKIDEVQINLKHSISEDTGVSQSYIACFQVVDFILEAALGIHAITPMTDFIEKKVVIIMPKAPKLRVLPQSTEKNMKRPLTVDQQQKQTQQEETIQNSAKRPTYKLSTHKSPNKSRSQRLIKIQNKTQQAIKQSEEKQKKRQRHAQKLKQQIAKLKEQKQQKSQEQRQKEKALEKKKKQREQLRQKYLEDNKKKIEEIKKKKQDEQKVQDKKEKQQKEKKKNQIKLKQAEYLEKQKKQIQQKFTQLQKKKKQQEQKQKQKEKIQNIRSPEALKKNKDFAEDQRIREIEIKNSIQKGQLKEVIQEYQKQLQELFQAYWEWKKQKMDLKGVVSILRDFQITPQYVVPKILPEVYKGVSKGQMIDLNGFIQIMTKLAFKSQKAAQQYTKQQKKEEQGEEKKSKLDKAQLVFFFGLLKMKQVHNYREIIKKTKSQQLG